MFKLAFGLVSLQAANAGTMREVFDDLTQFGVQLPLIRYPSSTFEQITSCMATAGDSLYPTASDAAWAGWTQFGINRGQPGDPWSKDNSAFWMEYDPRNLTFQKNKIPIIEPCNTVSNLAYYRIIPDLCANRDSLTMGDDYLNAVIQSFATLGMGSSFMHGSRTSLGGVFDTIPISVIAYQYFQLMTDSLDAKNGTDSILHELSATPRAYDGRMLATKLHMIPLEHEINDWHSALDKLERPQYYFTFGAIIINALTLVAPPAVNDVLIPPLMSAFGLSDDVKTFLLSKFIPTIRDATADINLSLKQRTALVSKFAGTVVKLLYSFMWQEQTFVYAAVYDPTWNLFGALLMPAVNSLANVLTGFNHADASIQNAGEGIYGGQTYCRVKATAPHAKWHEMSANGLVDLAYMADAVKVQIDASKNVATAETDDIEGSEVFMTIEVINSWTADLKAQDWTEGYLVQQAFGIVVKGIAKDMDACTSGKADGLITWDDLACYIDGISSAADFIDRLFESIQKHYKPTLSQVHSTPFANPVFV